MLCGDATVLADVERVLAGQLADMCFPASPYNVDYANSPNVNSPSTSNSPLITAGWHSLVRVWDGQVRQYVDGLRTNRKDRP